MACQTSSTAARLLAAGGDDATSKTFCHKPMPTAHSISTSADGDVPSPISGSDDEVEVDTWPTFFTLPIAAQTPSGDLEIPRQRHVLRRASSDKPLFDGQITWRNTFVHFPSGSFEDRRRASSCPPALSLIASSTRTVVQAPVLQLESALPVEEAPPPPAAFQPELGSDEMPTVGSQGHWIGTCRPCAFMSKGCSGGVACPFCHLCDPAEKKRRRKEKKTFLRGLRRWRQDGSVVGDDDAWEQEACGREQS